MNLSGLRVKLLNDWAKLPTKGYNAAGYDLYSTDCGLIEPGRRVSVGIGIATEIPCGYYGKIMDRSGLAYHEGITTLAGVIDNDYRGEWKVILLNTGNENVIYSYHERIAQVVFMRYGDFKVVEVDELDDTERGASGFGSTGK